MLPLFIPNLQEIPRIALIPFKSYWLGGNYACLSGKGNLQRTKLFTTNYNPWSATEKLVRFLICPFENFCPKQKPSFTVSVISQDFQHFKDEVNWVNWEGKVKAIVFQPWLDQCFSPGTKWTSCEKPNPHEQTSLFSNTVSVSSSDVPYGAPI